MSGGYNKQEVELTLRKLFIGGLRPDTTDEEFKDYFAKFGQIEDYVHIRNKETKQSKCFGFVTYADLKDVDNCLSAKPHRLNGKDIDVKRAVPKDQPQERCQKIFIGGLPETNETEMKEFFEKHGAVTQCQFKRDQATGRGRGFGFVSFEDFDTVDKLVIMKHIEYNGKTIECKKALDVKDKPQNMMTNGGAPNPSVYGGAPPPAGPGYGPPAYPPQYPAYQGYPPYPGQYGAPPPAGAPAPPTAPGYGAPPVAPGYAGYPVPPAAPGYPGQTPYTYPYHQAASSYGAQKNTYASNTYNSSRTANYKPY